MNGEAVVGLQTLADAIDASETRWNSDIFGELPAQMSGSAVKAYGNTFEAPILVFDGGDTYCTTGGDFTGYEPLVGFSWGVVYDVRATGAAEEKNIRMRLNPYEAHLDGTSSGGPSWGVGHEEDPGIIL